MNKIKNIFLIVLVSLAILMIVPSISAEATNNEHRNAGKVIDVPEHSRIVDLGNGLMRYDHVHRGKFAKPDKPGKPVKPDKEPGASPFDYKLLRASWWTAEDFEVNLPNIAVNTIKDSLDTWDNEVAFNIFGTANHNPSAVRNLDKYPDDFNTVTFENLGSSGIIAFARTWYIPAYGVIVESDVVFNSHYTWSVSGNPSSTELDLENIATHEFGHSAGLLDLYHWKSSENTMYGYADFGETKKRTLEPGDIAGIEAIYGK